MGAHIGCIAKISACLLLVAASASAAPLETAFTYQGELNQSGQPASGLFDFEFRLFDSADDGIELASPVALASVQVSGGIFTVDLDFGSAPFAGDAVWLEIAVAQSGGTELTILAPRQPVRVAPYALHAEFVAMDAIGTLEIQDNAVTAGDIAPGAVGSQELGVGAVTSSAIAPGAVGTIEVADNSLAAADLGPDSVTASQLADLAVDETAIVDGSVSRSKLAPAAVGAGQVDTSEIQARVSGLCPVGRMIRGINADGAVVCGVENKARLEDDTLDDGAGNGAGFNSSIAVGTDGLPVIVYPTRANGGTDLAILKCNDLACSGGDESALIVATPSSPGIPHVAIGSDGIPVIAFGFGDLLVARCSDRNCTSASISDVDVGPESVGFNPTVAIGIDGFPVIAYRGASSVKVAKCNDLACSGGDETISVADPENLAVDTTIVIGADGLPLIAYASFADFTFRVAKCNDAACADGDEQISILDDTATGVTGRNNDIVIPADGLPLLVYEDGEADTINAIKCNDAACAGGDDLPVVIDAPGSLIGLETALVIGVDGNPMAAYWDFGPSQVRLIQCNDPNCAGQDESSQIVSAAAGTPTITGSGLDMALGTDGLPIVSYYNGLSPGSLAVLRCGRSDCAPFDG